MTTPTIIRWHRYDGGEPGWSEPHALHPAPCGACCCGAPHECPDCGGRVHQEYVEGLTADGWQVVHAQMCERCCLDYMGEPVEVTTGTE